MPREFIIKRFFRLMQTPAGIVAIDQTKQVLEYFGLRLILPITIIGIWILAMEYYNLFLLFFGLSVFLTFHLTKHYINTLLD